jgi:hypothetical protein
VDFAQDEVLNIKHPPEQTVPGLGINVQIAVEPEQATIVRTRRVPDLPTLV